MNTKPLVSVIALCYNHAPYAIECLESIQKQTYSFIELIIMDDCSTDESVSVINNWIAEKKINCRFISHQTNLGICKSLNEALSLVNGEFVSIIATDDVWLENKITEQINKFQNSSPKTGVVYGNAYQINEKSQIIDKMFIENFRDFKIFPEGNIFSTLLKGNFIPAPSVLIKRSCYEKVGNYDEELCYEDYDMWLRMARHYEFAFCPTVNTKYRILSSSLSRKMNTNLLRKRFESEFKIYMKNLKLDELNQTDTILLKKNIHHCINFLYYDESPKIVHYLKQVLRSYLNLKILILLFFNLLKIPHKIQLNLLKCAKRFKTSLTG